MKTAEAIGLAGSVKALADLLSITSGAISQWGENVPDRRVWQLKVLRPAWFEVESSDSPATPPGVPPATEAMAGGA